MIDAHENPTEEMANAIFEAGVNDGSLGGLFNLRCGDWQRIARAIAQQNLKHEPSIA